MGGAMGFIGTAAETITATMRDVLPIASLLVIFQLLVLRKPVPHWPRVLVGFGFVVAGLALFLVGLETAIFPLGKLMAGQLSAPEFVTGPAVVAVTHEWWAYGWLYLFAALVGFSSAIAEPALIAVAYKAHEVSRGTISQWGLRLVVAAGVGFGVALGTFRIVTGGSLPIFIVGAYIVVMVQTIFAPRMIVPLAFDSGGVTTSTVTVPLVAAIGLGLSSTIPGRNPLLDGFGLIAYACLFPIVTVMGYAQLAQFWTSFRETRRRRRAVKFKIVVAMVKTDLTERVVDAAKAAGGTGATVIPAHGTGIHEAKTFFGLTLEVQTDVVLMLLEEHLVDAVMGAISEAGRFSRPGTGIAFVIPVDRAIGLESQIPYFERQSEIRT